MGDSNIGGDGGEVDGDGGGGNGVDGDGSGALPCPGRVPEQRLMSPKNCRWQRRSCRTLSRKLPINLGFSVGRLYIGGEVASEGSQGAHTTPWRGQEGGTPPPSVAALWPPSGSPSVSILRLGKIGVLAFVSSNSKNISCVAFLKHKNSRK
jgi:hypothetical protein